MRVGTMRAAFAAGTLFLAACNGVDDPNGDGGTPADGGDGIEKTCVTEPRDGPYSFPALLIANTGDGAQVADLNGDGADDVVIVSASTNQVQVALSDGAGDLTLSAPLSVGMNPQFIRLAKVDADAHLDLVVLEDNQDRVSVYPGNGDGTFGAAVSRAGFLGNLTGLVVADLNGDGKLDLLSMFQGIAHGYAFKALGNGDGTFEAPTTVQGLGGFLLDPRPLDVDGDGDVDLVYARGAGELALATNDGAGNFTATAIMQTDFGNGITRLELADVDGDGKKDIVIGGVKTDNSNGAAILFGNGGGTFGDQKVIPTAQFLVSIAAADVSRDGHVDLFFAAHGMSGQRGVVVVPGAGNRDFGAPEFVESAADRVPNALFIGDFNKDGFADVGAAMRDLVKSNHSLDLFFGCAK